MVSQNSPSARFAFCGGRLCLDFANTVYAPGSPRETGGALADFDDIVAFLQAAGTVDRAEARRLRMLARRSPRRRATAFAQALKLRVALRSLCKALASGKPVRRGWVALLNRILRSDRSYPQLVARDRGWSLAPVTPRKDPLAALIPVARSAAELVQEGPTASVRKCANPTCLLYFYDTSRTGRRRWCSMTVCGNRMKVAAHARRRRASDWRG